MGVHYLFLIVGVGVFIGVVVASILIKLSGISMGCSSEPDEYFVRFHTKKEKEN